MKIYLAGFCNTGNIRIFRDKLLDSIKEEEERMKIYMAGGVARNTGVVKALERELATPVKVSEIQQLNGAYGAAVYGFGKVK